MSPCLSLRVFLFHRNFSFLYSPLSGGSYGLTATLLNLLNQTPEMIALNIVTACANCSDIRGSIRAANRTVDITALVINIQVRGGDDVTRDCIRADDELQPLEVAILFGVANRFGIGASIEWNRLYDFRAFIGASFPHLEFAMDDASASPIGSNLLFRRNRRPNRVGIIFKLLEFGFACLAHL